MGAGHGHTLYLHEHTMVHRLPPEAKVLAAFLFVAIVALTPREWVSAFVGYAVVVAIVVATSRIPIRFLLARLAAVVPFVIFALFLPFIGGGEQTVVIGVEVSVAGAWAMWNILAKAVIGASTSIALTATTESPDILKGLGRLRTPAVLTGIASFMIRYLEVVAGELSRMRVAMAARGYDPRWLWQARPIASSAGALFVRSYERGERIHDAMLSRGFVGTMPDANAGQASLRDWALALLPPFFAVIVLVAAWLMQ